MKRLFQGYLGRVFDVLAAHRAAPATAEEIAEDVLEAAGSRSGTAAEEIAQVPAVEMECLGAVAGAAAVGLARLLERLRLLPVLAVAVVLRTLLGV